MLFPSETFLFVFLPLVLALYFGIFVHFKKARNIFLLLASLLFYAWGEPKHVYLMVAVILLNWFFGMLTEYFRDEKKKAKIVVAVMLVTNLGILGYFKYAVFLAGNVKNLFHMSFTLPQIALPIGISFFTFQAMSYVLDVYRGDGEAMANPLNVGLYISFFPQLIAGPIVRYQTVADQIKNRRENLSDVCQGACRFILGLGKKVIIANNVGFVADQVYDLIQGSQFQGSVLLAWLGAISYTLQIFFDFSGYSDMAIGLGRIFGFHFNENFNYPYVAGSVTEFWRRWHISLSSWFRDYVYIPLGGNRKGRGRMIFNMFLVWTLTGIWHGANWTFVLWGLFYFVVLTVEKLSGISGKKKFPVWGHILTLVLINFGWVIFRAESLSDLGVYLGAMFGRAQDGIAGEAFFAFLKQTLVYYLAALVCSVPLLSALDKKLKGKLVWDIAYVAFLAAILIVSITFVFRQSYNPFIYFNF